MPSKFPLPSKSFPGADSVRRHGFTLLELLVVMGLIIILSGFVVTALGGDDGTRSLNAAISRMDASFAQARSLAITLKTPTRVLVNFNPANENYLRSAQVFYFNDKIPTPRWEPFSEPENLPRNIVFNRELSGQGNSQLRTWNATVNPTTFAVSNPGAELSTALSAGANQWIAYEFNSNGTARFPMSRFILSRGVVSGANVNVPDPGVSAGFVLFRSGKAVYFKDYNHMAN